MSNRIAPKIFTPKPPLEKDYGIHYRLDYSLNSVQNHTHQHYEFYFLISGTVQYSVNDQEYNLYPGDILLIPPEVPHRANIMSQSAPYERYVLWLEPSYIEFLSSPSTNLLLPFQKSIFRGYHIHLSSELQSKVDFLLQQILILSHSLEYGSDLLTNHYIAQLLIEIAKVKLYQNSVFDSSLDHENIILKTLNYIADHIYEDIQVTDIARALYVSRSYLSKRFTDYMGIPIHQNILKRKLYMIRQNLDTNDSAEELCAAYGFGNYSSFFRAFKKEFGISPTEMRKKQA